MPLKSGSFSAYSPVHCCSIRWALLTYTNRSTAPHSPHSPLCRWCAESTGRRGARGRQQRGEGRRRAGWCGKKKRKKNTQQKNKTPFYTQTFIQKSVLKVPSHLRWINPGAHKRLFPCAFKIKALVLVFHGEWPTLLEYFSSAAYLDHSAVLSTTKVCCFSLMSNLKTSVSNDLINQTLA